MFEFEGSQMYRANSRAARTTLGNLVSKTTATTINKHTDKQKDIVSHRPG